MEYLCLFVCLFPLHSDKALCRCFRRFYIRLWENIVRPSSLMEYFLKLVSDQFQGTGESHPWQRDSKNQVLQGDIHYSRDWEQCCSRFSLVRSDKVEVICLCIRLILCASSTRLIGLINIAKSINLSIFLPSSLDLLHLNWNQNKSFSVLMND